jgi:hypothetical protein
MVGYNKDTSTNGFIISGMQFFNDTNTPQTVYGDQMPKGTTIYKFNGATYDIATYTDVFVPIVGLVTKWDAAVDLRGGDGYWLQATNSTTAVKVGEVPLEQFTTNSVTNSFNLVSYPYPVERVVSNLGFNASEGDKVYVFSDGVYEIVTYGPVFVPIVGLVTKWSDETLPIAVGQGFWYETTNATSWIVERPFDQ